MGLELPIAGPPADGPVERADAARNRERILTVARQLVGCRGIEQVSMQEIAREAGVGAGTVYRRFGDRAGLALALLEADTVAFQEALLRGPAPMGPGAPAIERLKAFGHGYLDLMEEHAALINAADPGGAEDGGPYVLYLTHIVVLLREVCPAMDAELTARVLLAGYNPRLFLALRGQGWSLARLRAGWDELVDRLAGQPATAVSA